MAEYRFAALLLDLDGTLYFKGEPIAGAADALRRFRARGLTLRFLTNTDSKTPASVAADLVRMGLEVDPAEVFTPASAAERFFQRNPGKRCFCLLSRELAAAFGPYLSAGGQADYVVVGDCREFISYELLNQAFQQVMGGADIIALQKGRYFIRQNGYNLDTGAFVALLEYASGKRARVLGKPSPDFFSMCLDEIGAHAGEVAIVGDDVTTDIAGARNIGATAVLVRTGKFTEADLAASRHKPDLTLASVVDLVPLVGGD